MMTLLKPAQAELLRDEKAYLADLLATLKAFCAPRPTEQG